MYRCYNPQASNYHSYGGRGIRVCDEWHNPWAFFRYLDEVLGDCPFWGSLDRIDTNSDYKPGNVRWATPGQQNHNRRSL